MSRSTCPVFRENMLKMLWGSVYRSPSPEDTILAKLRWAQLSGGSEKQFADALRVYEVQYAKLDLDYLANWAEALNVGPVLKRLQDAAQIL